MNRGLSLLLERLPNAKKNANGYIARCPAHDDRHASLSVALGDDGRVLLNCHAGCSPLEVCQAMGLRLADLFPQNNGQGGGRIVATYDYTDANGALLFQVVRFEPKRFRQRRPDGKRGWIWKLGRTPRVLYRLPELIAAGAKEWVFVVEGEKDAARLASAGLIATCNPGGAGKWSKLSDDSALHNRRVAIIADKDEAGRKHASDVAMRLRNRAREVRVIELPGDGKDAFDWFDAGGTVEELLRLVETARDSPAPSPPKLDRPNVFIDTEEHRVVRETIAALTVDPDLYQRGGILVRVIRDRQPTDGILRCEGSATIQAMPAANLRERMTRVATFTKLNRKGEEVAAHPAAWAP